MDAFIEAVQNSIYINLIYENRYMFILKGFGLTLYMTFATFLIGTVLGAVFCKIRLSKSRAADKIVTMICNLFVRLPTLVLLLIFVYMLFSDWDVDTVILAIFAFSMKTGSYITAIMYSAVKSINPGEIEAGRTLGMSSLQVFMLITLPQAIKHALPTYKNQLIITMQETSLVGFLAINDLTRASQIITSRTLDPYISIIITAVAYLLIGAFSNLLFKLLERDKHLKKDIDYKVDEV
jgi:His/Glu/Gln/Arg/opine family amino acid ABC transporter permease subunit